ncbi:MAG: PAS domain S-box protein [Rhodobacteraceae bacterium]|nr:PAS domain S-box protein [Paracoccaceae bacterium]
MIGQHGGISPFWLLATILAYIMILLVVGAWAERRATQGRRMVGQSWLYALSLTVYCTSWTYFGSVGSAANSGMLYATIYLGPTLVMLGSWVVVRRMIRLRHRYHFSSVVDLITQRHGHSVSMGAFITLVLLIGMVPYIGLQLRALAESFDVLSGLDYERLPVWRYAAEVITALVALLTGAFGLRRVDTLERQHGLMAVLAVESLIKLVAFVAVGVFVTWGLFDGFADLLARLTADPALRQRLVDAPLAGNSYVTWMTYLVMSMAAIVFLPRMFHVMIVGNQDERHLITAMWVFPLYLLLISFFALPIAAGGLLLGYPLNDADWFVVRLPFDRGSPALALLAYLGGFSAAIGMVMVACTTMAVMFSNHIVLPLLDRGLIGERLRGSLLPIRWLVVVLLLALAHLFEQGLRDSYLLIQMGLISFAAVLQFVPAGIGGLYWTGGNRRGAWWGLALGWATWAYTLLLPAVVRSGFGDAHWLAAGPWAIEILRPQALFGLELGSPYANAAFWSLLFNVSGYIVGSLLGQQNSDDAAIAHAFGAPFDRPQRRDGDGADAGELRIACAKVREQIDMLFSRYLPKHEATLAIERVQQAAFAEGDTSLSGAAYLELTARAERTLAGAIGAAMARKAASEALRLSDTEAAALQATLTSQVAELRITPQQLRAQVDYFRSLQTMSDTHALAMQEKIAALEEAVRARQLADASRRESEQRFRSLADNAPVMIWMSSSTYGDGYYNRAWTAFTGESGGEKARAEWTLGVHPEERAAALRLSELATAQKRGVEQVFRCRRVDGEYRHLRVHILPRHGVDGTFLGIVGSAVDISDLLAAEQSLRRSNEELEARVDERTRALQQSYEDLHREKTWSEDVIRLAPTLIIGLGQSGEIILFNDYAERTTGYARDEVMGKSWVDTFATPEGREQDGATINHALETGEAILHQPENAIVIRDGSRRLISWGSQVMGENGEVKMLLSFGVDVTDSRRAAKELEANYAELKLLNQRLEEAQNQLLQSEKMASIGQLAAGVAHEINNPVGFVSSNLQTLKTYCGQMLQLIAAYQAAEPTIGDVVTVARIADLKEALDFDFLQQDLPALLRESEDGLQRVKKIVVDLKDFSHVSEAEWQHADLNAGLDSTLNVVWNEVKYKARVDKHYGTIPPVECLAAQLNQVFMNLIVNAAHAIDDSKGMGTITLSTGHQDGWVWVEVRDSGRGMTEEVQRRVFEPFFTTKPVGKGTGLGMSLSYGIVRKHNGRIELGSTPGHGTRFRVWLPVRHDNREAVA